VFFATTVTNTLDLFKNLYAICGVAYSPGDPVDRYMDEIRLTDAAEWSENFTPPTSVYPDPIPLVDGSASGSITTSGVAEGAHGANGTAAGNTEVLGSALAYFGYYGEGDITAGRVTYTGAATGSVPAVGLPISLSSGLKAALTTYGGLLSIMQYGHIEVYTGAPPASADEPTTGTRVARITQDGLTFSPGDTYAGLELRLTDGPRLINSGKWVLKGTNFGTAGWFRWKANSPDDDSLSTTLARIDGIIPYILRLPTYDITPTTEFNIVEFTFSL
jgi:hypothetical protein